MLDVLLTIDVEIWCDTWAKLDEQFPHAFARYVYGRSSKGSFALPMTFEDLDENTAAARHFSSNHSLLVALAELLWPRSSD